MLAVGLVSRRHASPRASSPVRPSHAAPTLYFTFSRGAWLALVAGIAIVVAVSPRRLAFVTGLGVLAVPSAIAVALSYHARPLRLSNVALARAVGSGHSLAWQLLLVIALGGLAGAPGRCSAAG